ncbi:MAG: glycoside hydrolase family 88 protein [Bacteroidota bacterium]|nr:glycoside hydrolase family 88 protein [Bacteroidota bacterium]
MLNEIAAIGSQAEVNTKGGKKQNLVSPRSIDAKGSLVMVKPQDWTSGFFPGVLWFLFDFTHKNEWKEQAQIFTSKLENEKWDTGTHDLGFMLYCSYGSGYRVTSDTAYRSVILQGARSLSKRFNPKIGCIKSWDFGKDKWQYPVIIDNMMNLEMLFAATRLSGDSSFYKIAVSHANNTMRNHFRSDFSSYHVVDYDTVSGKERKQMTFQGYSDASAWARGQGWALYGFTMCYRETHNPLYLKHAENIAAFILKNPTMPADKVPYWDFNAPGIPSEPRDVSAAAVIASALYELGSYSKNGKWYYKTADKIVESLTRKYRSVIGENKGFILTHSTGFKPAKSEIDVPLSYADYYYLEAIYRKLHLKKK